MTFAFSLTAANVSAGVVVAVATLVVNKGDRFPALNVVTVPAPPVGAEITPFDMVMVLPSGFTQPICPVVAVVQDSCPLPLMVIVEPSPLTPPTVDDVAKGKRAAPSVPEEILLAFVVSVVALVANATLLVFVQVVTPVPEVVQSPLILPLVIDVPPENIAKFPDAGDPVVVTVPVPLPEAEIMPFDIVIVVPSGLTHPSCEVVAFEHDPTTLPAVGEKVRLPSEFVTEETPDAPMPAIATHSALTSL